jgi:hypothetical protein
MRAPIADPTPVQTAPLISVRQLANLFDLHESDGSPAGATILEWWHSGRIPPPDLRISRKALYWRRETIERWIETGGIR